MWLFTDQGFYSVVAHRDERGTLIVRARTRDDIDALRRQIPTLNRYQDADADYRWRAHVSRAEWLAAMSQLVTELDYPNFKGAVAARQSWGRARLYSEVWELIRELQR